MGVKVTAIDGDYTARTMASTFLRDFGSSIPGAIRGDVFLRQALGSMP